MLGLGDCGSGALILEILDLEPVGEFGQGLDAFEQLLERTGFIVVETELRGEGPELLELVSDFPEGGFPLACDGGKGGHKICISIHLHLNRGIV